MSMNAEMTKPGQPGLKLSRSPEALRGALGQPERETHQPEAKKPRQGFVSDVNFLPSSFNDDEDAFVNVTLLKRSQDRADISRLLRNEVRLTPSLPRSGTGTAAQG